MKIKKFRNLLSKKNFYYFFFFIFVVQFYNGFLNTYILLRNNYEERMINNGGYCENQAYGFISFINKKYKDLVELNIPVINFSDSPSAAAYFYDTHKKKTNEYLIITNPSKNDLKNNFLKKYQVIEQFQNCYFLKKK